MKFDDLDKVPDPRKPASPSDVRPVVRAEPAAPVHRRGAEDGAPEGERRPSRHGTADADSLSLHGIPEPELTPAVRRALSELMREIGQLREENEALRRQRDYLDDLVDQDPQAPVLNRRAFEREVAHALSLDDSFGATSTLALVAIENLHAIETAQGVEARTAVLSHVGRMLAESRETSDVVGRLGEGVFALVLVASAPDEAGPRLAALRKRLALRPPVYGDRVLSLDVGVGLHPLQPGERVDAALDAAERDRLGRGRKV